MSTPVWCMQVTFHCHIHPYDTRYYRSFQMRTHMKKGTSTSELSSNAALVKATLCYEHILILPVWQKFAKLSNSCPCFKKIKLYSFSLMSVALQYKSCSTHTHTHTYSDNLRKLTLILRRSCTGTVWFYTSTSNKRAARPKLYTKSLKRDLKLMYSRFTLVRISINL